MDFIDFSSGKAFYNNNNHMRVALIAHNMDSPHFFVLSLSRLSTATDSHVVSRMQCFLRSCAMLRGLSWDPLPSSGDREFRSE